MDIYSQKAAMSGCIKVMNIMKHCENYHENISVGEQLLLESDRGRWCHWEPYQYVPHSLIYLTPSNHNESW